MQTQKYFQLLKKICAAKAMCDSKSSADNGAYYKTVKEYLTEIELKLLANDINFDYLREFPIGNIVTHVMDNDADQDASKLLREIDISMLELTNNIDYKKFKADF